MHRSRLAHGLATALVLFSLASVAIAQPSFDALSPADATVLASGTGTLTGVAVGATSLTIDGTDVPLGGGGAFSWPFDLAEGARLVQLRATDGGGQVTEQVHTLVVDTTAPQVSITTPATPRLAVSPVTIAGSITEPHLQSLTIGGVAATVDAGSFTASVALVEGAQTITVSAVDQLGHASSVDLVLTLDTQAPTVTVTEAGQAFTGGLFNRPVTPVVTFTDASERTTAITLDGQAWTSGTTIGAEGDHTLRATATDAVGWSTEVVIDLTIDTTPPSIDTLSPTTGTALADASPTLTVVATGATRVRAGRVGGSSAEVLGASPFAIAVGLIEGENEILVEAFDEAGNRVERLHRLVLDTTPPALVIEAPSAGDVLATGTVRVAGSAPDPRLLEVRVTSPAGSWLANLIGETFAVEAVDLVEGANALDVVAKDSLGNETTSSVTVTLDSAAPTFQVTANGAPLASGSTFADAVTLAIQVDDPAATLSATLDSAPFTSPTVVDSDGTHELQVTVTNTAGTSASGLFVFVIDRAAPTLDAISPAAGTVQADASVTLHGRAVGAVEVTVDGQPASIHGRDFSAGPFSLNADGPRDFVIVARGRNGLETTSDHRIVRDATAPTLTISSPADGALTDEANVDVAGTVADAHLDAVTVSGVEATVSGSTFLARRVPLAEGETTLVVRAEDIAGNATEVSRSVVRDTTAPTVTITDPADGTVVPEATWTVRGTASDAHLDRVEVAGVRATVAEDGTWSADVALVDGANVLDVVAFDRLGATATASRTVHRDADAPAVAIVVPGEDSPVNTTTLEVRGTVDDEAGTTVQVNGQIALIDQGSWVVTLTLQPGENRLTARATDAQGNQGIHTRTVILDQDSPSVVRTEPVTGALAFDLGSSFRVVFDEPIAPPEADDWSLAAGGQPIAADLQVDGDALVVDPQADLPSAADVTLRLEGSITDRAGNLLGEAVVVDVTTRDTGAPSTPTLDAVPAAAICAPSLVLDGTADPATMVAVAGGASATQGRTDADGAFRLDVALQRDRFHRLELTATDADGDTSPALVVEVSQDCRPPAVAEATLDGTTLTVTFDEAVVASTVDPALALTDESGALGWSSSVAEAIVTVTLGRTPVGTTVLDIAATVTDSAGNALAFPYRRLFGTLAGDSFVAGTVLDDATGRPLAGAAVRVTATGGVDLIEPVPQQTTGEDGRFLIAVPAGTHRLMIDRSGYTPVFRVATTTAGEGTQVFDPRLTPAAASATVGIGGGSIDGSSATEGSDPTLDVPAGALGAIATAALSGLDEQGLPVLLPYGWSPRGAAWLDLDQPLLTAATLTLPVEAADGLVVDAVGLDLDTLQWRLIAQPTVTDGAITMSVDGLGAYAAVEADVGATAPPLPLIGEVLGSAAAPTGLEVSAASLTFDPEIVLPTQRARATVSYTLDAVVPSGLPLTLSVEETLERLDGSTRRQAPYQADLVVYKTSAGTPRSRFYLEPSDAARAEPLRVGTAQVDVLRYGDETVRGDVLGPEGGSVTSDAGDRLDIPAGALIDPAAVDLVRKTAADLPLAAPRGGPIVGVVEIDLGGASLTAAAHLFFAVDPAPTGGSVGLLLHVDEIDGAATYRAVAAIEPTVGGWTTSAIDPADLAWPGAREGGLYALVELITPHGYLRGVARDPLGSPLADAVIASESVDWVQRSNADGAYVLPLPVAVDPHTVTVVDPISGDQVAIAVTVDTDGGRVDLDPTVQVTGPWVAEITPGDGAEGVPVGFEPLVRFSEPVDRASLAGAITLSSDGQPVEIDLDHQGDRVTLRPRSTLLPGVRYAISIGLGVRDLTGHPLQSPVATSFTTQADPVTGDRLDRDKVRLFAPGADGLARVVGLPGAVPADTLVYVENLSAFTSTESVTSDLDGSFELTISATLDHRLLLHVLIEGSSEDLLLLGPYLSDDERAAYIPPTGDHRFLTVDGMVVTIDEGTFSAATWVRLEPRDADSDPIETDPDLDTAVRFRLDLGGQIAAKPLHVRLPVPVGVDLTGDPDALLLRYIRATYREGWMVDDLLRVEDGAFTNEPPTPKHATRKSSGVESSTFRTPRNARVLSAAAAELLAADPRAVLPLDPRDVEQASSIPLPPPWQPSLARSSAKSTFDGSVESATVGVLSSGDYQVALARIPLAWLIVPAIYPDLVAFNHAWDPSMASYLDSHRFALGHRHFLLPTPSAEADAARTDGGAASKAASGWELQVVDTATGYELYHETGNPPTGEPIVLEADVYGDVAPPLPVGGSPLRFVLIQTPPDGVLDVEVAPGITVTSLDGELKATGVSGTVGDRVQVQLVTAGGSSRSIGASEADGSFEVAVSGVRPGEIVVLTAGAVLAGTDRIEIAWSETLARSSVRSGLQVFPYIDDKLAKTPIEVDPLVPGTGEVAYLRPPTGWRSGRYVLRLDGSLSDEAVPPNYWPRQLDGRPWESPLDIEFEIAQSANLGTFQVPRFADVARVGQLLFVAASDDGLRIVDASHPMHLRPWFGRETGLLFPGGSVVRGVDADIHGRVWAVGGGEGLFGQLRVYDPTKVDPATVDPDNPATVDDAFEAMFQGSILVSDPIGGATDTALEAGLPRSVAVGSRDRVATFDHPSVAPADLALSVAANPNEPFDSLLTISGTWQPEDERVTVRNVDRGRFETLDRGTEPGYTIVIDWLPGERIEVRRAQDASVFVTVDGAGLVAADVGDFWGLDITDASEAYGKVRFTRTLGLGALAAGCDPNRPSLSQVPIDVAVLSDADGAYTVLTLVPGFGLATLAPSFQLLGAGCGAVREVASRANLVAMAVAENYPIDRDGDGHLSSAEQARDYVAVSHREGFVLIFDVTERAAIERVGQIDLSENGAPASAAGLAIDREGRRIYVAGFGSGVHVLDFDRLFTTTGEGGALEPLHFVDLDENGIDDRVLERLAVVDDELIDVELIPELGLVYAGGRNRGLTAFLSSVPRLDLQAVDQGSARSVREIAPFGVPIGDSGAPGAIRVVAALPGLATDDQSAADSSTGRTLFVDLVGETPGGGPIDGPDREAYPELPPTRWADAEALELKRLANRVWEAGYRRYRSTPVALLGDLRASILYDRTVAETALCDRCDQVAAGLYDAPPTTEAARHREMLSGHKVTARLSPSTGIGLDLLFDRLPRPEVLAESVPWDLVPSPKQEPNRAANFGNGDVAPGTLLHSGEATHTAVDLAVPGLGFDLTFHRTYRSQTLGEGPLGPGWDHGYRVRLRPLPNGDVELYDGHGRRELYGHRGDAPTFSPPAGRFDSLRRHKSGYTLTDNAGNVTRFDRWGRLSSRLDASKTGDEPTLGTEMTFHYDAVSRLVRVASAGRQLFLHYDGIGRLIGVEDDTGRQVEYVYDGDGRLSLVRSPDVRLASDFAPQQLETTYEYDTASSGSLAQALHRRDDLVAITDARGGSPWLELDYVDGGANAGRGSILSGQVWGGDAVGIQVGASETRVTDRRQYERIYQHNVQGHLTRLQEPTPVDENGEPTGPPAVTTWEYGAYSDIEPGLVTRTTLPDGQQIVTEYVGRRAESDHWIGPTLANVGGVEHHPGVGSAPGEGPPDSDPECVTADLTTNGSSPFIRWSYANHHARTQLAAGMEGPQNLISGTTLDDDPDDDDIGVGLPLGAAAGLDLVTPLFERSTPRDPQGRVTKTTIPLGDGHHAEQELRYVENSGLVRKVILHIDEDETVETTIQYDGEADGRPTRGFVEEVDEPEGVSRRQVVNALGWVLESCDEPAGVELCTRYTYDELGRVVEVSEPFGPSGAERIRSRMAYGLLGETIRIEHEIEPGGEWVEQVLTYDENRNVESISRTGESLLSLSYDERNLPIGSVRIVGGETIETATTYDVMGRPIRRVDARGEIWKTYYDGYGRVARRDDPIGHWTHVRYNDLHRPLTQRACSSAGGLLAENLSAWDVLGRPVSSAAVLLTEVEDEHGDSQVVREELTTHFELDRLSQLVKITDPLGHVVEPTYDRAGRQTGASWLRDGLSEVYRVVRTLDDRGRSTRVDVIHPIEDGVEPVLGNPTSTTTSFVYDARDRVVRKREQVGSGVMLETDFAYDAQDQLIREDRPDGTSVHYAWDALGRPTRYTRPDNLQITLGYQIVDEQWQETYVDALGQTTTTTYDGARRPVSVQYPDGQVGTTAYDGAHLPISIVQPNGTTITQAYDAAGRMNRRDVTRATEVPGVDLELFDWDGLGRLGQISRGGYTTEMQYDTLSRMVSETTAGKTVGYAYDPTGNLTTIGYPSAASVVQSWTDRRQLEDVRLEDQMVSLWSATVDWAGALPIRVDAGGVVTTHRFDEAGRRIGQTSVRAGRTVFAEDVGFDGRGLLVASRSADGSGVGTLWTLDDAGRVIETRRTRFDDEGQPIPGSDGAPGSLSPVESFDYDRADNLLARRRTGVCAEATIQMPLDVSKRNRPASVDGQALTWDENGNLTRRNRADADDLELIYDDRNRLVEVKAAGGTIATYEYDALNRRVLRTVGGETYRTVWDGWRAIEEYQGTGDDEILISRRTFGTSLDDVLLLEQRIGLDLVLYTPIYDAIGNLVALVDDTGRIVERYAYSTYGERIVLVDDTAPAVEHVRLDDGSLVIELSEAVVGDPSGITLHNSSLGEAVPISVHRPVLAGRHAQRRLVITPTTAPDVGNTLDLTIPANVLRDTFDNEASSEHATTLTWSPTGVTVLEDTAAPTIDDVCVVEGKVRLGFSESIDLATASALTVGGQSTWQPVADGYGIELSTTLDNGDYTLDLIAGITDLVGNDLLIPTGEELHLFTLSKDERTHTLFVAPYAGESAVSTVRNTLGFQGLSQDSETGFYYVRNRYYDPELGRFTQPDPFGYADSQSMYQFALNNPVSFSDPTGELVPVAVAAVGKAMVAGAVSIGVGMLLEYWISHSPWGDGSYDYSGADGAVDFTLGAATLGLSNYFKLGKHGVKLFVAHRGTEALLDVGMEYTRARLHGREVTGRQLATGAALNFLIGEAGGYVGNRLNLSGPGRSSSGPQRTDPAPQPINPGPQPTNPDAHAPVTADDWFDHFRLTYGDDAVEWVSLETAPYGEMSGNLPPGQQAHHLGQNAALQSLVPRNEGLAFALYGNAFRDVGTEHYMAHEFLEQFWAIYRKGGDLHGKKPTVDQYRQALISSLFQAGLSRGQATELARRWAAQLAGKGVGPDALIPNVPNRMGQRKREK